MATTLRTLVHPGIGTTPVQVLTPAITSIFTIIGCNLANTTDYDVIVSITITDATSTTAIYISNVTIRAYTSLRVISAGEKLVLAGNCIMTIVSDTTAGIDATFSYADMT